MSGSDIIAPPTSVIDNPPGAVNDHQQAFNEVQNLLLPRDIVTDQGTIVAGTLVSSHMIFLNTLGGTRASDTQTWGFDNLILGVMSNRNGSREINTSDILGSSATAYPTSPFSARGLEGGDSYAFSGDEITVTMTVTEPGDWIRVVTRGSAGVPDGGGSILLLSVALAAIAGYRSRQR